MHCLLQERARAAAAGRAAAGDGPGAGEEGGDRAHPGGDLHADHHTGQEGPAGHTRNAAIQAGAKQISVNAPLSHSKSIMNRAHAATRGPGALRVLQDLRPCLPASRTHCLRMSDTQSVLVLPGTQAARSACHKAHLVPAPGSILLLIVSRPSVMLLIATAHRPICVAARWCALLVHRARRCNRLAGRVLVLLAAIGPLMTLLVVAVALWLVVGVASRGPTVAGALAAMLPVVVAILVAVTLTIAALRTSSAHPAHNSQPNVERGCAQCTHTHACLVIEQLQTRPTQRDAAAAIGSPLRSRHNCCLARSDAHDGDKRASQKLTAHTCCACPGPL